MSTTEAGDPNNYPTSITIPSDGDGPSIQAADVAVGFEGLADRTAWLKAKLPTFLVTRKTAPAGGGLSIVGGGTTTANATVFSAGITTVVGDEIEVHFVGNGAIEYGIDSGGNEIGLSLQLSASQNGGAFAHVASTNLLSSTRTPYAANGTLTKGSVAMLGLVTIATAGTLTVRVEIAFTGVANTGDLGDLINYRAVLNQYRSAP